MKNAKKKVKKKKGIEVPCREALDECLLLALFEEMIWHRSRQSNPMDFFLFYPLRGQLESLTALEYETDIF